LKYLIIIAILLIIVALILRRLKPYLIVARQMFGVVQTVRRMNSGMPPSGFPANQNPPARDAEKLVRCRACETWMPASRLSQAGSCTDCAVKQKASQRI